MNDLFLQLPEFDPHPDLWARIEADLDSDVTLARLVDQLPQLEPKADLWAAIDGQITQLSSAPATPADPPIIRLLWRRPVARPLWAGLAAVAVIILVGTWLVWPAAPAEIVRMEYAVEQTVTPPIGGETDGGSAADRRAEAFIDRQCAGQPLICERPDVHELRGQLVDLTTQQKRLEQEQLTFGDDPALVRAQVQIENQRAEVTKELITLLRS